MYRTIFFLTLSVCLHGQSPFPFTLTGEVENAPNHFTVELVNASHQTSFGRSYGSTNGHFTIASVEPGHYEVHVLDESGRILRIEYTDLSPSAGPLMIRLPVEKAPERPVSGVISAKELTKERRAASRLLDAAMNLRHKADIRGAMEKCMAAIERDPTYALAHLELANRYMDLKQPWDARNELLKAVALEPKFGPAYTNLAIVDLKLGNVAGAEQAAVGALALNRDDPRANYLKKVTLWLQHKGPKPDQTESAAFSQQQESN